MLTVEHAGFQKMVFSHIELAIDQRARQDVSLQVGQLTSQVTVEATATLLESEETTLGQVIDQKRVQDMPLNGRNFIQLAQLSTGVTPIQTGMTSPGSTYTGRTNQVLAVAGSRETDTSYTLDGIETRNGWWGTVGVHPSIDAIQEFKIQRNTFSAEFGFGAAIVNTSTKAGTNEFHGTLFEYLRNNKMDARNFFDYGTALQAPKPAFQQNQFGGTFGGAIIKNKLFFFLNYEGFRQRLSQTSTGKFPTQTQLSGAFSTTIIDPSTNAAFPGNVIPANRFDPLVKNFLPYFVTPNCLVCGAYNYAGILKNTANTDQTNNRVDYHVTDKDALFFRYTWDSESEYNPGLSPASGSSYPQSAQNAASHWVHILSPTATNELLFGWGEYKTGIVRDGAFTADLGSQLGLQNLPDRPSTWGIPGTSFSGYARLGPIQGTQLDNDKVFQGSDTFEITRGRHILKFGAELRHQVFFLNQDSRAPSITFAGTFTRDAVADFLLGDPRQAQVAYGNPSGDMHRTLQAYYVQDDLKLSSRLTLNLGLRYEYGTPPTEVNNRIAFFDTSVGNWFTPAQRPNMPRSLTYPERNDWAPRVGLAWRVTDKLSLRTAYGIYYIFSDFNQEFQKILNPIYYPTVVYGPVSTPVLKLSSLFLPPAANVAGGLFGSTKDPHERRPYMHQYNFTLQYSLTKDMVLELGYTGSAGHRLPQRLNMNAASADPTGLIPLAQRVRWPQYSSGVAASLNEGNSNYNALNARLDKRFSGGFSVLASYTYAKCLDDGITDEYLANPANLRADRGQCTTDIRQRFVTSYIYDLPFGKGQRFLANMPHLADTILGHWQLSGITTFATGPYISPSDLVNPNLGNYISYRPNRIGAVNNSTLRDNIRNNAVTGPYFTVTDLVNPVGNVYGTAARDFILCPGLNNWDISLFKIFPIRERANVQFRSDFFNAFNHAQFGPPNATAGAAFAGQISTAGPPRDIQLSLKIVF